MIHSTLALNNHLTAAVQLPGDTAAKGSDQVGIVGFNFHRTYQEFIQCRQKLKNLRVIS